MRAPAPTNERLAPQVVVRAAAAGDADACARIFYDAFESIAASHNFPVEPASREFTRFKVAEMLADDGFAGLVAERDGDVLGSAFADERAVIAGIGPVSVDPAAQDEGIGRVLAEAALERQRTRGAVGVRLVQTAYHYRSLALYAKLGFAVREPLACMQGQVEGSGIAGSAVRPATRRDLDECCALCFRVHGHERRSELREAIDHLTATVVERDGRITGYATVIGFWGQAVAAESDDLKALIAAAQTTRGAGILVPTRNGELFRWCLARGLRMTQPLTLMTLGLYNEPAGAFLPSILF